MAKLPVIVPITDLRQDAAAVLDRTKASSDPIIITQRGRAAAVLMSIEAYETAENRRRILEALLRGEKDIAANKGFDLEDVMAEADELLKSK